MNQICPAEDIQDLARNCARIQITKPNFFGKTVSTLLDVLDRDEIGVALEHLAVHPQVQVQCKCAGDLFLHFYDKNGDLISVLSYHHDAHLRKRQPKNWGGDAYLVKAGFQDWVRLQESKKSNRSDSSWLGPS